MATSSKTTAAKRIVRVLKARGLRVGGAKLTGVGRYRDILGMRDAGADFVLDFVDAGLPSTACPADEFEPALRLLKSGKVRVAEMISDRLPLAEAPRAFERAAQKGVLKVLLEMDA